MLALSATKTDRQNSLHWLNQLDIRAKVLTLFVLSLSLIFLKNIVGLIFLGGISTLCLLSLKKYRLMAIIYLLLSVSWCFSLGSTWVISLFSPNMKDQTLLQTMIPFLRMWPLINMALSISLSMEIGHALICLKNMRLPRIIYLPVMVALRFIPGFLNDIRQLRDCLLIRGISMNFFTLVRHPNRTLRLMIVPMLIRALRLADELAVAAEMKRVGYGRNIHAPKKRFRWCDSTFFVAALLALFIAWNIPGVTVKSGMSFSSHSSQTTDSEKGTSSQ